MAVVASPYLVRPMTVADIPQVTEIERESFPTMWPQTAYKRELQQNAMARYLVVSRPLPQPSPGVEPQAAGGLGGAVKNLRRLLLKEPAPPAHTDEQLAGFLGLWFMLEECHVVTVAVREALRRQGIGELLVITAVELALRREQEVLTLECRVSNTGAQALYERYGFERVGVRHRYYTDNNEDALIMTTPPIHTPEYRERFARLRAAHAERWGESQLLLPD
jgi:ribosomal-protein-alanine N-acetyltransferase